MDELLVAIQNAANTIAAPNWADIMSVCFSLLAIVVAGFVAWKQIKISREQTEISKKQAEISQEQVSISDKQNKIALFEKRLEIYNILISCNSSVEIIKSLYEDEDILKYLFTVFSETSKEHREYNHSDAKIYLTNCAIKLEQAPFFFPEKIIPHIIKVSINLLLLTEADIRTDGPRKFNERKQNYFEAVKALGENNVFETIREEMTIM